MTMCKGSRTSLRFLGRSPDPASFEDVRRYQLHLAASGVGVPTINQTVSTLRFFFKVTLKRHEIVEHTHVIHEPRKLRCRCHEAA
jgi:integrase/recombinase XerD